MQQIWQAKKTIPVPVNVANRPGGSGTIGYQYLNTHPADAHYLAITSPTLLTNHIVGTSKLSYTEMTPVALLSSDYMIISVKAESPIRTGREFIERLRKDPGSLSIATGSVVGGTSHIGIAAVLTRRLQRQCPTRASSGLALAVIVMWTLAIIAGRLNEYPALMGVE